MPSSSHSHRDSGFTLVEVLVALVVLSIGLLGMAKMAMVSSHANDSAYLRSQATALAYEILDKMRANVSGATGIKLKYNTPLAAGPVAAPSCVGAGANCSDVQLAAWDLYSWKQRLAAGATGGALPSGQGQIVVTTATPATATVTVQWDDSAAQSVFSPALFPTGTAAPMSITLEAVIP